RASADRGRLARYADEPSDPRYDRAVLGPRLGHRQGRVRALINEPLAFDAADSTLRPGLGDRPRHGVAIGAAGDPTDADDPHRIHATLTCSPSRSLWELKSPIGGRCYGFVQFDALDRGCGHYRHSVRCWEAAARDGRFRQGH